MCNSDCILATMNTFLENEIYNVLDRVNEIETEREADILHKRQELLEELLERINS